MLSISRRTQTGIYARRPELPTSMAETALTTSRGLRAAPVLAGFA